MQVLTSIADVRAARRAVIGSVGLVPTMGALHEGHLTLVREARAANDCVAVSIFVNPTQFGPNEDFAAYPRDTGRDLDLLRAEGVDLVFMPAVEAIYPEGFATSVDVGPIAESLEGEHRPGHFLGVATVVLKLLNIVQPARAYFGRKDAQQLAVIRRMVRDLDVDVEIVAANTVREPDGLAMSSRNAYLSPAERQSALVLWNSLCLAREMWTRGARDAEAFRKRMRELIEQEESARIDYVSVADPQTLREVERINGPVLVSLAVRIGRTRLIDNITLGE
ncbi:MAG TPA: pantoate--beta-alanine ligase [Dehalococcoidia bacterium]|jgi:pantoate--beta-alanine ligase|nr:pantoate--beta-alanine ligase [Dehalococcoidia bacterium]